MTTTCQPGCLGCHLCCPIPPDRGYSLMERVPLVKLGPGGDYLRKFPQHPTGEAARTDARGLSAFRAATMAAFRRERRTPVAAIEEAITAAAENIQRGRHEPDAVFNDPQYVRLRLRHLERAGMYALLPCTAAVLHEVGAAAVVGAVKVSIERGIGGAQHDAIRVERVTQSTNDQTTRRPL